MNELKTFLENNIIGILTIFIAPLLAWFFNRRKDKAEIDNKDANSTSIIATSSSNLALSWETFAREMRLEYSECVTKTNILEQKIDMVTNRNNELELKFRETQYLNKNLKDYTEKLVGFVEDLLVQIEVISHDLAQVNKEKLIRIKNQFENESVVPKELDHNG